MIAQRSSGLALTRRSALYPRSRSKTTEWCATAPLSLHSLTWRSLCRRRAGILWQMAHQGAFCRLNSVKQQHSHRHRANPAWNRRDVRGLFLNRREINIADKMAIVQPVDAHVYDDRPRTHYRRVNQIRLARCNDEMSATLKTMFLPCASNLNACNRAPRLIFSAHARMPARK